MQLQSALREFDFLHNEEKGGPQGAILRPLVTEPRPVLIAPPSPRTPSPQPVVEFPEDEVHTSTSTHNIALLTLMCVLHVMHRRRNECLILFSMLLLSQSVNRVYLLGKNLENLVFSGKYFYLEKSGNLIWIQEIFFKLSI